MTTNQRMPIADDGNALRAHARVSSRARIVRIGRSANVQRSGTRIRLSTKRSGARASRPIDVANPGNCPGGGGPSQNGTSEMAMAKPQIAAPIGRKRLPRCEMRLEQRRLAFSQGLHAIIPQTRYKLAMLCLLSNRRSVPLRLLLQRGQETIHIETSKQTVLEMLRSRTEIVRNRE